eukprot:gene1419-12039_t
MSSEQKLSDEEIAVALKVLSAVSYDRQLLAEEKFKKILDKGKELFTPRSSEDKKKLRKQRKTERISHEAKKKMRILNQCGMKQKKEEEKNTYWKFLQELPPRHMLENGKASKISDDEKEIVEDDLIEITDAPKEEEEEENEQKEREELDEKNAETCYNCAKKFTKVHHFYDRMCPDCADLNWSKRNQIADMKGKIAIVTGGRVKIGFEIALILLRCKASVIVTTRFPKDCAVRFGKEKDFDDWKDKLHIYGLDMRHIPSVIEFTAFVNEKYPRLDMIINNAAQTIRRPTVFYKHLVGTETKALKDFKPEIQKLLPMDYSMLQSSLKQIENKKIDMSTSKELIEMTKNPDIHLSVVLSQIPVTDEDFNFDPKMFPNGALDVNGQQIDLRDNNTWNYELKDVSLTEFMEVQTINSTAPFILNSQLRDLMAKDKTVDKWIINVSAMEGQFYRLNKTTKHPHTNMAKASLNMMTRTCGAEFAKDRIYMNSVDTGWVTDERAHGFKTTFSVPLDEVDGAARCVDPIITGMLTGKNIHSKFLKDYHIELW